MIRELSITTDGFVLELRLQTVLITRRQKTPIYQGSIRLLGYIGGPSLLEFDRFSPSGPDLVAHQLVEECIQGIVNNSNKRLAAWLKANCTNLMTGEAS